MIKIIPTTIYDCRWYLAIDETRESVEKHLKRQFKGNYKIQGEHEDGHGYCLNVTGTGGYIVINGKWEYQLVQQGLLAHECLHAAMETLGDVGFSFENVENIEPLTYLHQFYFQQCMKIIAQQISYEQ